MRKGRDFDTDGEVDRSKSKRKEDEAIWEGRRNLGKVDFYSQKK